MALATWSLDCHVFDTNQEKRDEENGSAFIMLESLVLSMQTGRDAQEVAERILCEFHHIFRK